MARQIGDRRGEEKFARALESGSRREVADLLTNILTETDQIEAKVKFPPDTKLAKHLMAIGNSGGGAILLGVEDGPPLNPVGMDPIEFKDLDNTKVHSRVRSYVPAELSFEYLPFDFSAQGFEKIGDYFAVVFIDSDERQVPYIAERDGTDIKAGDVYVRRNGESVRANYAELQGILERRVLAERRAVLGTERLSRLLDALEEVSRKRINAGASMNPLAQFAFAAVAPDAHAARQRYLTVLDAMVKYVEEEIRQYIKTI